MAKCIICYESDEDFCNSIQYPCLCKGSLGIHSICLEDLYFIHGYKFCSICNAEYKIPLREMFFFFSVCFFVVMLIYIVCIVIIYGMQNMS